MLDVLAHPDETGLYAEAEALAFRGIARVTLRWEKKLADDARRALHTAPIQSPIGETSVSWTSETALAIKLRVKGRA